MTSVALKARAEGMSTRTKIVLWIALAVFVYALPLLDLPIISTPETDFGGVLFTMAIYCLVAIGLNIVVGYAGLLDLGYVGFYAIGAYTVAILTTQHGSWPYLLTIPVAIAVAMLSGLVLGAPTLRVRGDYLAIVTLGFGEIIRLVAVNFDSLTNGARGIQGVPHPPDVGTPPDGLFSIPHLNWDAGFPEVSSTKETHVLIFGVLDAVPYYWFAVTVVILMLFADILIKSSRVGRAWEATREDEDAAELMGVPTFKFKLLAFAMGACVGGLAGALYAGKQGFVSPQSFAPLISMLFVAAVVVGGSGNRWGVLLGAALVVYLPERLRGVTVGGVDLSEYRFLFFGILLMVVATFRPEGLLPPVGKRRAKKVAQELEALEETVDEPEMRKGESPHA